MAAADRAQPDKWVTLAEVAGDSSPQVARLPVQVDLVETEAKAVPVQVATAALRQRSHAPPPLPSRLAVAMLYPTELGAGSGPAGCPVGWTVSLDPFVTLLTA